MAIIIFTGTPFSGLQTVAKQHGLVAANQPAAAEELSELSREICRDQYEDTCELAWTPFSPPQTHVEKAKALFSSMQEGKTSCWADIDCGLFPDFWLQTGENIRFVFFYTSPEYELANYLEDHEFDSAQIDRVITSWVTRSQAMLSHYLKHRDHCVIVNIQALEFEKPEVIRTIRKKFGFAPDTVSTQENTLPEKPVLVKYLTSSLLLGHEEVSELYDALRSAASFMCQEDSNFLSIFERNQALVAPFLKEVSRLGKLTAAHAEVSEELSLKQRQLEQLIDELGYYYEKSKEQHRLFADYLAADPLLNIAHRARQVQ